MLFNSIAFLLFFPAVCVLYYGIPTAHQQWRNLLLLVASYYFYMNWEPVYALLLFSSTLITYASAIGIDRSPTALVRKCFLATSIVLNLSILSLFKYYNFIAESLTAFLDTCGWAVSMPSFRFLLPVGISFYTFQALGYTIDVYRKTTKAEHDFATYALFVSFFPQLVAGPIERSSHLLPQFRMEHPLQQAKVMEGVRLMAWGYFLKLVMADRCAIYVDAIFNNLPMHNGGSYLLASLLFTFQIYGDFAGYSLIAIGAARILGFQLMDNFRRPYFASTVGEFWHRWHISLSTWFQDYVYIPLGGNRVGRWRCYLNVMVTFIVSGLWHGAAWTFVWWGALHGGLLCIERASGISRRSYTGLRKLFHVAATFTLVSLAWIPFRASSLSDARRVLQGIVSDMGFPYVEEIGFGVLSACMAAVGIVLVKELAEECHWHFPASLMRPQWIQYIYVAIMAAIITLFGVLGGDQFIYFQF